MKWREYEIYIERHFRKLFPEAQIAHNVRRKGVISKIPRQIDLLIETTLAGFPLSIVIDCKCFSKKVDIKDVEAFLSFLRDLRASKGIMITNSGYSEAAYDRAMYDTHDVELRIIDFKDLDRLQAFGGIPYSRGHCAIISAPDGWILDAAPKGPYIAALYPAGLSEEEAASTEGFIYVMFSHKDSKWPNMKHLLEVQEREIKQHYSTPRLDYVDNPIQRDDCKTTLRILEAPDLKHTLEFTLFLDFPEVILFLNLLTPRSKEKSYRRKLEWVAQKLIKGKMIYDASKRPLSTFEEDREPKDARREGRDA
jgi:hypothetical protein